MPSFMFCAGLVTVASCLAGTLCYFWAWHSGYQQGWEMARGWPVPHGCDYVAGKEST